MGNAHYKQQYFSYKKEIDKELNKYNARGFDLKKSRVTKAVQVCFNLYTEMKQIEEFLSFI